MTGKVIDAQSLQGLFQDGMTIGIGGFVPYFAQTARRSSRVSITRVAHSSRSSGMVSRPACGAISFVRRKSAVGSARS